jgi:CxxC motif-containing protein
MSKFSLFQELEGASKPSTKKYQVYEIQSGIEIIKAKVPVEKTTEFEKMCESLADINVYSVKKLLDKLGGSLQE